MVIGVDEGPHGTEEVTIYNNTNKVISTVGPVPPAAPQEQLPSTVTTLAFQILTMLFLRILSNSDSKQKEYRDQISASKIGEFLRLNSHKGILKKVAVFIIKKHPLNITCVGLVVLSPAFGPGVALRFSSVTTGFW